jgi:16S rRNA (guanine527-N7)-methyltransferase
MFHVKHDATEAPKAQAVEAALNGAGIRVLPQAVDLLVRHARAVFEANASFNLTRITTAEEFIRLHIVDSLLPWTLLPFAAPAVDIGSGAGFPGVPTSIVHGGQLRLCESVGKKARFLESCVGDLGLECDVFCGRAEELALLEPQAADLVVARAVSSIASLVELAAPLLATGGRLIALKGDPNPEELAAGERAAAVCGMQRSTVLPYTLPEGGERRTLVVYERVGRPAVRLPRRAGLAQHSPLS